MKRIYLLIILIASPCFAFQGMGPGPGVKAYSGGDVTAPEFSSATINGTALVVNWSEACTRGAGYADTDVDLDMSTTGANIAVTYASGDGTSQWTYTAASAAVNGETVDLDFNGDADSIEDGSGNDLAALVSSAVTNNTPAASYDFEESFDTATGYDNTWNEITGNPDEDYTTSPAPLEGTQSLFMGSCANSTAYTTSFAFTTDAGQQTAYFRVHIPAIGTTNTDYSMAIMYDSGSNIVSRIYINRNTTYVFRVTPFGGTSVVTTGTLTTGTTYHVKWIYQKGTGANAFSSVEFSTDGTFAGSGANYASSSNGTRTTDGAAAAVLSTYSSATNCSDWIIDRFLVNETIGDNP